MAIAPRIASDTNHTTMIGPKSPPTLAVPRRWNMNRATMMPIVIGMTARSISGSSRDSPSTALSTVIAGVMRASQ